MLYVIREFGQKKLDTSKDAELIRRRHTDYFLALAEESDSKMGKADPRWLERLDTEHGNFRSALKWCQNSANSQRGSISVSSTSPQAIALRLSASLGQWW
ncbi:hypothetical protein C6A37_10725, partial [Desulfobacteraceae bacterium SEEP-SAG9]